jgi:hypothetical protein
MTLCISLENRSHAANTIAADGPHQHQRLANRCRLHPLTLTHTPLALGYAVMKNLLEYTVMRLTPCITIPSRPSSRSSRDVSIFPRFSCISGFVNAFLDSTSSSKLHAEAKPARDT